MLVSTENEQLKDLHAAHTVPVCAKQDGTKTGTAAAMTDRQTDRQTDRRTDRRTDGP